MIRYDELNVRLEPRQDGLYDVHAWGETGEASGVFELPFSDLAVENFILKLGRARSGTRRLESPEMASARDFGGRLFASLFDGGVHDLYRDCYAHAQADDRGLRLKLAFARAPELADLPWEYLYSAPMFLSVSQFTPIVRYLDLPRSRPPLAIELPLRMVVMVSAPVDFASLDVDEERSKVERALADLSGRGLVEVTWLEDATLRALQQELRRGRYHVFHFIGHGAYDAAAGESVLLFEDENERGRPVSGSQLGTILADHRSLRLAVLNACEGARTSRDDPFSGVAASLVQFELPAVVAMQFEITDRAAITFADEFYGALVNGLPVDAALAEARKAIYAAGNDIEWGTPVLFMRTRDGRLFDLPDRARSSLAERDSDPRAPEPEPEPNELLGSENMPHELSVQAKPPLAPIAAVSGPVDSAGSPHVTRDTLGQAQAVDLRWFPRRPGKRFIAVHCGWLLFWIVVAFGMAFSESSPGSAIFGPLIWWLMGAAVITTLDWAKRKRAKSRGSGAI